MPEPGLPFDPGNGPQREDRLHHFSHALKNRLGSLWQAATMLHDLPEGPERTQLLALAEKSYFNGARELERLMDDFSVPRGITRLERVRFDVRPLLEQCITNIAFRTERKEQPVRSQVEEGLELNGDQRLLGQLFEALLSNASKFSPKGSLIEVNAWKEDGEILVNIRDHGAGLGQEDLEQVFSRYAILSSRSTDGESQARSTLARAKKWTQAHGGDLSVSSEGPEKGTRFLVRLPSA